VTRQHHKFWLLILGILAMLSSMMSVTLVRHMAGPPQQMAQSSASHANALVVPTSSHAAMPCHKQTKPCPQCPKSICPDMAICLAKCVQQAPALLALDAASAMIMQRIGWPAPDQILAGSLIPPLLRPPSV
jgi:hypothetical protein